MRADGNDERGWRGLMDGWSMKHWRIFVAGMAWGNFLGYAFSGDPLRGVVCAILYALTLAVVELCRYVGRHVRWD